MFKEILNQLDMTALTTSGLILFFIVFLGVIFYALTRAPRQAEHWSRIPLGSEPSDIYSSVDER